MSDMGLDVRGRIYISSQGMNVQAGGTVADATAYAEWVKQQPGFQVRGRGPAGVADWLARRRMSQHTCTLQAWPALPGIQLLRCQPHPQQR